MKTKGAELKTKEGEQRASLGDGSRRTLDSVGVLAERLPVAIPNPDSYIPNPQVASAKQPLARLNSTLGLGSGLSSQKQVSLAFPTFLTMANSGRYARQGLPSMPQESDYYWLWYVSFLILACRKDVSPFQIHTKTEPLEQQHKKRSLYE